MVVLSDLALAPKPGFYHHFKHRPEEGIRHYAYEVLGLSFHTEEDEVVFVSYRPLYPEARVYQVARRLGIMCLDARPLQKWLAPAYQNGQPVSRFTRIEDAAVLGELRMVQLSMYRAI